jgi:hypothetical protein
MNKVILQLWEESNSKDQFLSNGCSLHLNVKERDIYISSIYNTRDNSTIPNKYDRIIGEYLEVFVEDKIFNMILEKNSVKINESSFQNLLKFEEIIFNTDTI